MGLRRIHEKGRHTTPAIPLPRVLPGCALLPVVVCLLVQLQLLLPAPVWHARI
jgi:hypothetical protein